MMRDQSKCLPLSIIIDHTLPRFYFYPHAHPRFVSSDRPLSAIIHPGRFLVISDNVDHLIRTSCDLSRANSERALYIHVRSHAEDEATTKIAVFVTACKSPTCMLYGVGETIIRYGSLMLRLP